MTDLKASHLDDASGSPTLTRRAVVKGIGVAVVALPVAASASCTVPDASAPDAGDGVDAPSDAGATQPDGGGGPRHDGGAGQPDASTADSGADDGGAASADGGEGAADAGEEDPDGGPDAVPWATGGTAAMTAAATYPNPFTSGLDTNVCALLCTTTLGPCYGPVAPVRQDVSEGEAGIPMRLMLRIVDDDGCTPVPGAEAEIWYCNTAGRYSGNDTAAVDFCTGSDAFAEAAYFARGRAIADANGVLTFDGTYPGWYPGRAVHIHVLVRRAGFVGEGTATNAAVVSQLAFPEALTAEIFSDVAGYKERGQPDRTLTTDGVFDDFENLANFTAGYAKMSDGAMLAWKTIAISDIASC